MSPPTEINNGQHLLEAFLTMARTHGYPALSVSNDSAKVLEMDVTPQGIPASGWICH